MKAAVYGLSAEGYALACQMATRGAQVSVIDESAHMAVSLGAEAAARYPDIASLKEDEPLMPMMPEDLAISEARYLFFCPVVRGNQPDGDLSSYPKFKEAVSHMKKNSSLVYMLPTGLGGSAENASLLERVTGLAAGRSVHYYYYPVFGKPPAMIGSQGGKPDDELAGLVSAGPPPRFVTLSSAEALHALDVVTRFAKISSILETPHLIRRDMGSGDFDRFRDVFLDDAVGGLYDLHVLQSTFESAGTMTYVINGSLRATDAYVKRLVGAVRSLLREPRFKTSRVRVAVSWTHDAREMRGDRQSALRSLLERLRDHLGDADMLEDLKLDMFHTDEVLVVIACSRADYEHLATKKGPKFVVVRANPLCEIDS